MARKGDTLRHLDHAKDVMDQIALECGVNLDDFHESYKKIEDGGMRLVVSRAKNKGRRRRKGDKRGSR